MKNLIQRTVSGIVYLVVIIGSLFLGKFAFGIVFLVIGLMSLVEFYNLQNLKIRNALAWIGLMAGAFIFLLTLLVASHIVSEKFLSLILAFFLFGLLTTLYLKKDDVIKSLATIFLALVYIIVPLSLMTFMVFPAFNGYSYTHRMVLSILIMIWVNDTGAYVTGSLAGRHRLFPRISPKKSWEGFAGGTLFTLSAAFLMERIMHILTLSDWMFLGLIVCIFGVYGDLIESLIKRNAGKKDSGNIIPGHGGVLDRIDSVLMVMPVAFIYLVLNDLLF